MLQNTFIHIPRVGKTTELKIWNSGINTWDEYLENSKNLGKSNIIEYLEKSKKAYKKNEHEFFSNALPNNKHWRAFPDFEKDCCFLDIETTGLHKHWDDITLIGLYNGKKSKFFIKDQNLNSFEKEIKKYKMIVTFNGSCFDLPFISRKLKIDFNQMHIDLRFAMKAIDYSGGLKSIERQVGITRDSDLTKVDGFEAVRLWNRYERGDEAALDLLLKYNQADIENLKTLMEFSFDKLKEREFGLK